MENVSFFFFFLRKKAIYLKMAAMKTYYNVLGEICKRFIHKI